MKNYALIRSVKLGIYFFAVYAVFTAIWYLISGRFKDGTTDAVSELFVTAAWFALLFSFMMVLWFRRTEIRLPLKEINQKQLEQKLADLGFERVKKTSGEKIQTYKPIPPKASAMAGKVFISRSANFYHLQGPVKYLKKL